MKSQKISNRAPRPFKNKADRWSGGHDQKSFIPSKPAVRIVKPAAEPPKNPAPDSSAAEK